MFYSLTISNHDSGTSALTKCTVHQDGSIFGQSPFDHIAHGFEYREKVFLITVLLADVDVRDPCFLIRFARGGQEIFPLN